MAYLTYALAGKINAKEAQEPQIDRTTCLANKM